jgi:hypothetical protein
MSSEAKLAANRSTGPITEAGKQIVAGNAVKHGLAGSSAHAVLPGEETAFEKHLEGYRKTYMPVGAPEESLVRVLAENYWRLSRAHSMEDALFEQVILGEEFEGMHPIAAQAKAWSDPEKGLQRIALYAARIQRAIDKATAELKSMQAERKAAFAKAQEEAILLTRLAASKGQTFDPAPHFPLDANLGGFVYSAPEIARLIARAQQLEEAKLRFLPPEPLSKSAVM